MKKQSFNRDWSFCLNSMWDWAGAANKVKVDLPHDFIRDLPRSADAVGGRSSGYFQSGFGRYEKSFDAAKGETVILYLDGVYRDAEVYLNGNKIFSHPYGYTPAWVDLSDGLCEGSNAVKIVCSSYRPDSRWYAGGGIYRPVALYRSGSVYIRPDDVFIKTPEVKKEAAYVDVDYAVTDRAGVGHAMLTLEVIDAKGNVASEKTETIRLEKGRSEGRTGVIVNDPALWSTEAPALYTLRLTVAAGDEKDVFEQAFGIREIKIDSKNGFVLNGQPMKLRGGCIHHDNTFLGAEAFPASEERKIRILKEAGFNAIRTAHNPASLALIEACDRLGMLVLEESFDCWYVGKNVLDYHNYFNEWWEYDTSNMVKRDRSHPSIFCWSIGNEIMEFDGSSDGVARGKMQADLVRRLDPTRPVSSGVNSACGRPDGYYGTMPPEACDEYIMKRENGIYDGVDQWGNATEKGIANLDIAGVNYMFRRYAIDRVKYPDRVEMGTETRSMQTYDDWQAVMSNPNAIGGFLWVAFDNLGEVGMGTVTWAKEFPAGRRMGGAYPALSCFQGDIDMTGKARPVNFYRRIVWGLDKKVHLYTRHPSRTGFNFYGSGWHWDEVLDNWNYGDEWLGKDTVCAAYADADEIAFILNGREMARVAPKEYIAYATVPYERGVLEAVAYRGGKEISRDMIRTVGEAKKLVCVPEKVCLAANGEDLAYIRVYLTDENGDTVYGDDRNIACRVSGAGELRGMGSGNPNTPENFGTGERITYEGSVMLAVRGTNEGTITVECTCEGVEGATVTLNCRA